MVAVYLLRKLIDYKFRRLKIEARGAYIIGGLYAGSNFADISTWSQLSRDNHVRISKGVHL